MRPSDRMIQMLLRGSIQLTPARKKWFVDHLPETDDKFAEHWEQLEKSRPYYMHLLNEVGRLQADSELKEMVGFFTKEIRGKLTDQKELEFFSVIFKICLDLIVEQHAQRVPKVSYIIV